jgi:hypothetical protein
MIITRYQYTNKNDDLLEVKEKIFLPPTHLNEWKNLKNPLY